MERAEKRSASADVCVNGVLRMADDSVEKKKSKEKRCFDKVLKCKSAKGEIAKRIRENILQNRSNVDCEGERPDIIIQSNTAVIGIEHCQTDVLFSGTGFKFCTASTLNGYLFIFRMNSLFHGIHSLQTLINIMIIS